MKKSQTTETLVLGREGVVRTLGMKECMSVKEGMFAKAHKEIESQPGE